MRRSPVAWLVAATFAVVVVVGVVHTTSRDSSEPVELATTYGQWLAQVAGKPQPPPPPQEVQVPPGGQAVSLKDMTKSLDSAATSLNRQILKLAKAQKPKRKSRKSRRRKSSKKSRRSKRRRGVNFSASRVTNDISAKIRAYEKIRERAAKYLLKNIAKTIIGALDSSDKLRGAVKRIRREAVGRRRRARASSQRRSGSSRSRSSRRRRRAVNSRNKRYEVNRGRYVVVVNQKNQNDLSTHKFHTELNQGCKKHSGRKRRRCEARARVVARRKGSRLSSRKAKFRATRRDDKRLARISKIALRSVAALRRQRHLLKRMRDSRKNVIAAATRAAKKVAAAQAARRNTLDLVTPRVVVAHKGSAVKGQKGATVVVSAARNEEPEDGQPR